MKIFNVYYNISTIIAWLTLPQLIYVIVLNYILEVDELHIIQHEECIFVLYLMTFFMAKAIEKLKISSNS